MESSTNQVESINKIIKAAAKPSTMEMPGGDTRHALVLADGSIGGTLVPPRRYKAFTVRGLADQVKDLATIPRDAEKDSGDLARQCRVFVGEVSVIAELDERDERQDEILLGLTFCPSFLTLKGGKLASIDQAGLIWTLRSQFPDMVAPSSFLATVRQLKFKSSSGGTSSVNQGNETKDLSIEASVAGATEPLAEEIVLSTSVYEQIAAIEHGPTFDIKCAVHINVQEARFTIQPLEGGIAKAMREARDYIAGEFLAEFGDGGLPGNVQVFRDSSNR